MTNERKPGTRLPDDPAYWDRLAARSVEAAFADTVAHTRAEPWWHALSDNAFVLAASAVLVLIGGALLLEERSPAATRPTAAFAAEDPVVGSLLSYSAEPPTASVLLRLMAMREERR